MRSEAKSIDQYLESMPPERLVAISQLRKTIADNLPEGFTEEMQYGMIGYVVPHSIYPSGYHCDPRLPLPFMSVASQKNFIAVYHMGLYSDPALNKWFIDEYPKFSKRKIDMGKSCLRFKKAEDIPYRLIGKLASKLTPRQWIDLYEEKLRR